MKIANLNGRAVLVTEGDTAVDVHTASQGRFGPDPASLFEDWATFAGWAEDAPSDTTGERIDPTALGAPSPSPRQIIAFGLNYSSHAAESGFDAPSGLPPVFPKFVSSLTGPVGTVVLPEGGTVDWEIELVVVIGKGVDGPITEDQAWDHVAGLTAGQDISDRASQFSTPAPQFGLGKSFPNFAPVGPYLVTPDEFKDVNDIRLTCSLDGQVMQDGRTDQLIYSIPKLIAGLSGVVKLFPGDLIFTGTPEGVGIGRDPKVFIQPGQVLVSTIEGIGELRQTFVAAGQDGHPALKALKGAAS